MKKFTLILMAFFMILGGAVPAFSYPELQLDITDSVYVAGSEETVFATGNQFTLYALLNGDLSQDDYYISAALVSVPTASVAYEPGLDLGTITFGGETIQVTEDMVYGTPPVDAAVKDNADLQSHGIFPTYYWEKSFKFDENNTVGAYNVQDDPGTFGESTSADSFYYKSFNVDVSNLAEGYGIHFDLYHIAIDEQGNKIVTKVDINAPFSHDAQANATAGTPEPATMILLGSGLLGLVGLKRRKNLLK